MDNYFPECTFLRDQNQRYRLYGSFYLLPSGNYQVLYRGEEHVSHVTFRFCPPIAIPPEELF